MIGVHFWLPVETAATGGGVVVDASDGVRTVVIGGRDVLGLVGI